MLQLDERVPDVAAYLGELDLGDVDAYPSRPHAWLRPSAVELEQSDAGPVLVSHFGDGAARVTRTEARGALASFLALADGSDAKIVSFARHRGALRVGGEGLPVRLAVGSLREPLSWYRDYARLLRATIRSAARVRRRSPLLPDDVAAIGAHIRRVLRPGAPGRARDDFSIAARLDFFMVALSPGDPVRRDRAAVAGVAKWWIQVGAVQELLYWDRAEPVLEMSGGLWGALGSQLVRAILRDAGPVPCSWCGQPIRKRDRRPKTGQAAYCDRERCTRERATDRQRRRRATRRRRPA